MKKWPKTLRKVLINVIAVILLLMITVILLASDNGSGGVFSDISEGFELIHKYSNKTLLEAAEEARENDIFDTESALRNIR